MSKTILCYGDSMTWGYIPGNLGRYPLDQRWTSVLQKKLGQEFYVVAEGLTGRYTVHDEPFRAGRNGAELLLPIMESHAPLNLVILFLGTNDLLHLVNMTAFDAARGVEVLVRQVQTSELAPDESAPLVLVVAPPEIGKLSDELHQLCHGNPAKSQAFAEAYQQIAEARNVHFFDAGQVCEPSPADGVHPNEVGHERLGEAIAELVQKIFAEE